ncbi:MAG: outer membrane beta-barrel protein [Candidatus Zixiibacteriota bacterium]
MKAIKLICFAVVGAILLSAAPAGAFTNFQGGLNLLLGFPQGDFKDELNKTGVGIGGEILYSPGKSIFGIGASLGFMVYGHEKSRVPFSPTVPNVFVEVSTDNNIFQGHLMLRVQPKNGPIRPYGEGLIGLNYLFTKTTIKDEGDSEDIASSTDLDDAVFSYGAGGGVMVNLYSGDPTRGKLWKLMLDLRLRYLIGGEAEYLKEGSILVEDGQVFYDISKSKTDMLLAQIGLTFEF